MVLDNLQRILHLQNTVSGLTTVQVNKESAFGFWIFLSAFLYYRRMEPRESPKGSIQEKIRSTTLGVAVYGFGASQTVSQGIG